MYFFIIHFNLYLRKSVFHCSGQSKRQYWFYKKAKPKPISKAGNSNPTAVFVLVSTDSPFIQFPLPVRFKIPGIEKPTAITEKITIIKALNTTSDYKVSFYSSPFLIRNKILII